MPTECYNGVNIPQKIISPCKNGDYLDDNCTLHAQAIPDFNIVANTPINEIIEKFKTIIISQNARTINLESKTAVSNVTRAPLTLLQLNTQYPLATIGFEVQCLAISTIYKKTLTGWSSQSITTVL